MQKTIVNLFFILLVLGLILVSVWVFSSGALFSSSGSTGSKSVSGIVKYDPAANPLNFGPINSVTLLDGKPQPTALSSANVTKMRAISSNNIYVLTRDKGLFSTIDAGVSWNRMYIFPVSFTTEKEKLKVFEAQILKNDSVNITDFWVSTQDEGVIYASAVVDGTAKIFKTIDSGNTFEEIYTEIAAGITVDKVMIDPNISSHLYAIKSDMNLIQSVDSGKSWQKIDSYITGVDGDKIVQTGILPGQKYFYFLFAKAGLATTKNGLKWELSPIYKYDKEKIEETKKSLQEQAIASAQKFNEEILKNLPTFSSYQKLIPVFNRGDGDKQSFVLLADDGMYIGPSLTSPFVEVKNIPVQDSKLSINDVVVDPVLGLDKIYIAVGNKLLESVNRGNTWKVRSTGIEGLNNINQILIDKANPEVIYLGLGQGQNKSSGGLFGF